MRSDNGKILLIGINFILLSQNSLFAYLYKWCYYSERYTMSSNDI